MENKIEKKGYDSSFFMKEKSDGSIREERTSHSEDKGSSFSDRPRRPRPEGESRDRGTSYTGERRSFNPNFNSENKPKSSGSSFGRERSGGFGNSDREGRKSFSPSDNKEEGGERRSFGGNREGGDRRPFSGGSREFKPRENREGGERRSFGGNREGGDRKPFSGGDREFKPRENREGGERRSFGGNREGGDRKPFSGGDREFKPRENREGGERRSFGGNREGGDRKPFSGGDREFKPRENREGGERRSFGGNREGGERRSFGGNREGGDRKPFSGGNREFKPRENREGGERRSFGGNREGGDRKPFSGGDREFKPRENREGGNRSVSSFRKESARSGGYTPSRSGQDADNKRPRTSNSYDRPQNDYQKKNFDEENNLNPDEPFSEQPLLNREIRLNRFVAMSGVCSRREADELIQSGDITINGEVVIEFGTKVKPGDVVCYKGDELRGERLVYIVMNKPKGVVTTVEDPNADKTIMDLLEGKVSERVFPVGRLDKNSLGVILLTNDGELASTLTHPSFEKKKIYHVFLDKNVKDEDMERIAAGLELEDGFVFADEISFVNESQKEIGLEIHSGRNRIVRRIFEHLGYQVNKLDRVYFAGLTKKGLKRGLWRYLTAREVSMLKGGSYK